jgi:hypothetical protein
MEMFFVKEFIVVVVFSDLVLVWTNEHLPLILYMSFHSVYDAEGLVQFSVTAVCVYCRSTQ